VNDETQAGKKELRVQTLGGFRVWRAGQAIDSSAWGREKALLLFQLFVTNRRRPLHKEQVIDLLWPLVDLEIGDRDFKVALNALNKALEPDRPARMPPRFVHRSGLTYRLKNELIWIDADEFEHRVAAGNQVATTEGEKAKEFYAKAIELYSGDYLPNRRYEDWTTSERERLQILALGTMTHLANLLVEENPLESIRIAQRALTIDPVWEGAYRTQMRAYQLTGNRPMAIRTYQRCVEVLQSEFAVEPLPETQELYQNLMT
jgi:DNA-binding SARP family transcriptional activator